MRCREQGQEQRTASTGARTGPGMEPEVTEQGQSGEQEPARETWGKPESRTRQGVEDKEHTIPEECTVTVNSAQLQTPAGEGGGEAHRETTPGAEIHAPC
ncbi:hypothetical protein NQD34_015940 [Periophthalmus magnuspinnatus]|nr:hypothetical protein NQD34_015940 [Periophthalmus magnuspinnatus]